MAIPHELTPLLGRWQGRSKLWLSPKEPAWESDSSAEVSISVQGQFLQVNFTWYVEDEAQSGLILVRWTKKEESLKAVWFDSWHMREDFMVCHGKLTPEDSALVEGTYAAPPGPDWGWRIEMIPIDEKTFILRMHNIPPGGEAELAVETIYQRMN